MNARIFSHGCQRVVCGRFAVQRRVVPVAGGSYSQRRSARRSCPARQSCMNGRSWRPARHSTKWPSSAPRAKPLAVERPDVWSPSRRELLRRGRARGVIRQRKARIKSRRGRCARSDTRTCYATFAPEGPAGASVLVRIVSDGAPTRARPGASVALAVALPPRHHLAGEPREGRAIEVFFLNLVGDPAISARTLSSPRGVLQPPPSLDAASSPAAVPPLRVAGTLDRLSLPGWATAVVRTPSPAARRGREVR
jgi:hypothetical protein